MLGSTPPPPPPHHLMCKILEKDRHKRIAMCTCKPDNACTLHFHHISNWFGNMFITKILWFNWNAYISNGWFSVINGSAVLIFKHMHMLKSTHACIHAHTHVYTHTHYQCGSLPEESLKSWPLSWSRPVAPAPCQTDLYPWCPVRSPGLLDRHPLQSATQVFWILTPLSYSSSPCIILLLKSCLEKTLFHVSTIIRQSITVLFLWSQYHAFPEFLSIIKFFCAISA